MRNFNVIMLISNINFKTPALHKFSHNLEICLLEFNYC